MSGLLVVNADDWGGSEATTEAILRAFEAGRVTSTSAMVHMPDSDRAAEVAKGSELPVGLHLNLTEPFGDPATPAPVRDRQRRVAERLSRRDGQPGASPLRKWLYDPRIRDEANRAIADQVERFELLYGGPPTHFDGHNYVDLCPNVFLSPSLPSGSLMRNSLDRFPLERSPMALLRSARQALRSRRFRSTRYTLQIAHLSLPEGGAPDPRLELAHTGSVEVISHPDDEHEREILMSDAWGRVLAEHRLGSFADLD